MLEGVCRAVLDFVMGIHSAYLNAFVSSQVKQTIPMPSLRFASTEHSGPVAQWIKYRNFRTTCVDFLEHNPLYLFLGQRIYTAPAKPGASWVRASS